MSSISSRYILLLLLACVFHSCCEYTDHIEYQSSASRALFQPSQVNISYEDSAGNVATLMYYNEDCEFSEWEEFEGTSDNCEFSRYETCKQFSTLTGTSDFTHHLFSQHNTQYFQFASVQIPMSTHSSDLENTIPIDSITVRGILYKNVQQYNAAEGSDSPFQQLIFSETYALLKIKMQNGTVWERLP